MKLDFAGRKWHIMFFTIALIIGLILWWRYEQSFQFVTFTYNQSEGSAQLHGNGIEQSIQPNQRIKLPKGEYVVTKSGNNIAKDEQKISLSDSEKTIPIVFNYTQEKLRELYIKEQPVIESVLLAEYPKIKELYIIKNDALYHKGEWYGATLSHNSPTDQNRDTLHVLMKKEGDSWIVISKPPVPILSKFDYPNVPIATLKAINQGK